MMIDMLNADTGCWPVQRLRNNALMHLDMTDRFRHEVQAILLSRHPSASSTGMIVRFGMC